MSRFIKNIALLVGFIMISTCSIAQLSLFEMLRYGDNAYEQKNYGSAVHFYKMVIDEGLKVERISAHPYAYNNYTGKTKKVEGAESDINQLIDSVNNIDSLSNHLNEIPDKQDFNENDFAENGKIDKDTNELYATHMIAECCRLMNDYSLAEYWYVQSLQLSWGMEKGTYPLDRYWYATILMNNNNYKQAADELQTFILDNEDTTAQNAYFVLRAEQLIKNCKYAQSSRSKIKGVTVKKGDSLLNNGSSSFAVNYMDYNNIILSSARNTSIEDKENDIDGSLLSDIFTMRKNGDCWEEVHSLMGEPNTTQHEGAASVGDDKKTMYFTRWYVDNKKEASIFVTKWFVDKWMLPRKLGAAVNVKGYTSSHPYISKNNKTLFFASDRPGGHGGMDIWYCKIDRKGKTSDPINLGPNINSAEDEITPFYHEATSVLYFSSTGHKNIGGYDVFKAKYNLENNYAGYPENMGYPINSAKNDKYFVLNELQTNGFLTSNRGGCEDCDDSHCNQIYTMVKEENEFLLSGYVLDALTDEEIPNAKITIKDVLGGFEDYTFETDQNGYYEMPLSPEMHIFLKAQKIDYFADANVQSTIGVVESEEYTIDFFLSKIPYKEIAIPGILYDYDKATLRPESMIVLDSLVDFLLVNNNLIIEISSHTDEHGSDSYNNKLSQERAQSVVNYLIENEIPMERLIAKGYGKNIPIVKNSTTEADDQKNRRTSFRILGEDFEEVTKIQPKE